MRYLQNENDTLIFKADDTSETVRLSARNDNQPIVWSDGDTAEIHVDKDGAHVKTAPANLVVGSNNVTFSTSELSELPAGQYQLELWTKLASDESQAIWPSQGMLDFTIDRNADSLEGGAITTITLDTFKEQLNQAIKEAKEQAKPGKSAYQTWIDQGNKGTEQDFLNSLKGAKGETGAAGNTGADGKPGLSAYQLAVQSGFRGTESEWLESLKGGPRGEQGPSGKNGQDGKSAYQIWLDSGNKGTKTDFLNSLVGPRGEEGPAGKPGHDGQQGPQGVPGKDGKDGLTPSFNFGPVTTLPAGSPAKASLVKNEDGNYTISLSIPTGPKGEIGGVNQVVKPELSIGTVQTIASDQPASASLTKTGETSYAINLNIPAGKQGETGKSGSNGENGADGKDGQPGKSAYELAVEEGFKGDLTTWLSSLKGKDGQNGHDGKDGTNGQPGPAGKNGQDGKSAYQVWLDKGNKGTETNFLNSLVGPRGEQGPAGNPGEDGKQGPQGVPGKDGSDGKNGHSIWNTSDSINFTDETQTVKMSTITNSTDSDKPQTDDLLLDNSGNLYKITTVTDSSIVVNSQQLASLKGPQGPEGIQGPAGPAGRDGKDASSNITVKNGMVTFGDQNLGVISENSSYNLHQSDFSYSNDMSIRIIPQQNFKTWTAYESGNWTLDVDSNTLTNDSNSSKKIKLMTGLYLLRDMPQDIKVISSSKLGLGSDGYISQITQLIVTPYLVLANAVVSESVNGNFDTVVEAFWRPNWDSDSMPYFGVKNDWRKL